MMSSPVVKVHEHPRGYSYGVPSNTPGSYPSQSNQRQHHINPHTPDRLSKKGNRSRIKVCVRKRPLNQKEENADEHDAVLVDAKSGQVLIKEEKLAVDLTKVIEVHKFAFDEVFTEENGNASVYEGTVKALIPVVIQRGKATCFAFGQTGAGKTHTLLGTKNISGLYQLATEDIFKILSSDNQFSHQSVWVSYFEIYCGQLYDLLNKREKIQARENGKHQVCITGVNEVPVHGAEILCKYVDMGNRLRSHGSSGVNSNSSRSHAVLQIQLKDSSGNKLGRLSFIDLAGSERASDAGDPDKTTRQEGAEINTSLLALKECIRAMDQDLNHTPFRQSKLTQVLRDSFLGQSRTCMIANIAPNTSSVEHTLNTLRYAARVKEIHHERTHPKRYPSTPTNFTPDSTSTPLKSTSKSQGENSTPRRPNIPAHDTSLLNAPTAERTRSSYRPSSDNGDTVPIRNGAGVTNPDSPVKKVKVRKISRSKNRQDKNDSRDNADKDCEKKEGKKDSAHRAKRVHEAFLNQSLPVWEGEAEDLLSNSRKSHYDNWDVENPTFIEKQEKQNKQEKPKQGTHTDNHVQMTFDNPHYAFKKQQLSESSLKEDLEKTKKKGQIEVRVQTSSNTRERSGSPDSVATDSTAELLAEINHHIRHSSVSPVPDWGEKFDRFFKTNFVQSDRLTLGAAVPRKTGQDKQRDGSMVDQLRGRNISENPKNPTSYGSSGRKTVNEAIPHVEKSVMNSSQGFSCNTNNVGQFCCPSEKEEFKHEEPSVHRNSSPHDRLSGVASASSQDHTPNVASLQQRSIQSGDCFTQNAEEFRSTVWSNSQGGSEQQNLPVQVSSLTDANLVKGPQVDKGHHRRRNSSPYRSRTEVFNTSNFAEKSLQTNSFQIAQENLDSMEWEESLLQNRYPKKHMQNGSNSQSVCTSPHRAESSPKSDNRSIHRRRNSSPYRSRSEISNTSKSPQGSCPPDSFDNVKKAGWARSTEDQLTNKERGRVTKRDLAQRGLQEAETLQTYENMEITRRRGSSPFRNRTEIFNISDKQTPETANRNTPIRRHSSFHKKETNQHFPADHLANFAQSPVRNTSQQNRGDQGSAGTMHVRNLNKVISGKVAPTEVKTATSRSPERDATEASPHSQFYVPHDSPLSPKRHSVADIPRRQSQVTSGLKKHRRRLSVEIEEKTKIFESPPKEKFEEVGEKESLPIDLEKLVRKDSIQLENYPLTQSKLQSREKDATSGTTRSLRSAVSLGDLLEKDNEQLEHYLSMQTEMTGKSGAVVPVSGVESKQDLKKTVEQKEVPRQDDETSHSVAQVELVSCVNAPVHNLSGESLQRKEQETRILGPPVNGKHDLAAAANPSKYPGGTLEDIQTPDEPRSLNSSLDSELVQAVRQSVSDFLEADELQFIIDQIARVRLGQPCLAPGNPALEPVDSVSTVERGKETPAVVDDIKDSKTFKNEERRDTEMVDREHLPKESGNGESVGDPRQGLLRNNSLKCQEDCISTSTTRKRKAGHSDLQNPFTTAPDRGPQSQAVSKDTNAKRIEPLGNENKSYLSESSDHFIDNGEVEEGVRNSSVFISRASISLSTQKGDNLVSQSNDKFRGRGSYLHSHGDDKEHFIDNSHSEFHSETCTSIMAEKHHAGAIVKESHGGVTEGNADQDRLAQSGDKNYLQTSLDQYPESLKEEEYDNHNLSCKSKFSSSQESSDSRVLSSPEMLQQCNKYVPSVFVVAEMTSPRSRPNTSEIAKPSKKNSLKNKMTGKGIESLPSPKNVKKNSTKERIGFGQKNGNGKSRSDLQIDEVCVPQHDCLKGTELSSANHNKNAHDGTKSSERKFGNLADLSSGNEISAPSAFFREKLQPVSNQWHLRLTNGHSPLTKEMVIEDSPLIVRDMSKSPRQTKGPQLHSNKNAKKRIDLNNPNIGMSHQIKPIISNEDGPSSSVLENGIDLIQEDSFSLSHVERDDGWKLSLDEPEIKSDNHRPDLHNIPTTDRNLTNGTDSDHASGDSSRKEGIEQPVGDETDCYYGDTSDVSESAGEGSGGSRRGLLTPIIEQEEEETEEASLEEDITGERPNSAIDRAFGPSVSLKQAYLKRKLLLKAHQDHLEEMQHLCDSGWALVNSLQGATGDVTRYVLDAETLLESQSRCILTFKDQLDMFSSCSVPSRTNGH